MRKLYLGLLLATGLVATSFGQTKSTGVVTLYSGFTLKIDVDNSANLVTFTMAGPANNWLSIGLNTTAMPSSGDCLSYNTQLMDQHFVGVHNSPASDTTGNLTLVSSNTSGNTKTIVFTRPLNTGDSNDYTFNYATLNSLNIIWSIGYSNTTQEHNGLMSSKTLNFNTLGTEDFSMSDVISIFPNPSNGIFKISSGKYQVSKIRVFDINAKLLKTVDFDSDNNDTQIDLTGMAKGTYFLELSNETDKAVKKIQIN